MSLRQQVVVVAQRAGSNVIGGRLLKIIFGSLYLGKHITDDLAIEIR